MKTEYDITRVTEAHQTVYLAKGFSDMKATVSIYVSHDPWAKHENRPFESEQDIRNRLAEKTFSLYPREAFPFRDFGDIEVSGWISDMPAYTTRLAVISPSPVQEKQPK